MVIMRKVRALSLLVVAVVIVMPLTASEVVNPAIDMDGYLRVAAAAASHRASRRVTEEEFIRMTSQPGTVILDARSRAKYDELHVKGAMSLPFPDIAVETLKAALPDVNTRILLYCNNNFRNADGPFPAKLAT